MSRPQKNNADYFSHDNDMRDDEKIKALRRKFAHTGYSVWNMLLEKLCKADNFRMEYDTDSVDLMAGDFNVEPEILSEIMEYLFKLKLIIRQDKYIFSQTMITRFEGLFRKRKRDTDRLSLTITPTEELIANDNPQSKVKETKEKEIKEKGNSQAPHFFNSENFEEIILATQKIFEKHAPNYVWENKDREQLLPLLQKICITKSDVKTTEQLGEAFANFLQKLPEYWRSKKFTIPHLNGNYNEIISEIRAEQNFTKDKTSFVKPIIISQPPETKREPSLEEKLQLKKDFIKSICEAFEKFVSTGQHGYLPLSVMYDTLVEEKVLQLSAKKLQQYRNQAIEARRAALSKPKNAHETKSFRVMLENFSEEILRGTEKHRIEKEVKTIAVQDLFEELKKKNTDIKTLFKK